MNKCRPKYLPPPSDSTRRHGTHSVHLDSLGCEPNLRTATGGIHDRIKPNPAARRMYPRIPAETPVRP
mgnify:CR=1 FL=1